MKVFYAEVSGKLVCLGGVTSARKFLKANPGIAEVERHWWSGKDLIEVLSVSRDSLFAKKAKTLVAGATAKWAWDHK